MPQTEEPQGQPYHPHLTHFLTTENAKWAGPAASHLTLYVEPVGGKLRLAAQDIQNKDAPHGLMAYGAAGDRKFFLFMGIWLLMSVGTTFKTNTIARRIGRQLGDHLPPMEEAIPMPIFRAIAVEVRTVLPSIKTAKGVAGTVFRVWERMHARPPGILATLALLLVYLLAGLLTAPWVLPLFFRSGRG